MSQKLSIFSAVQLESSLMGSHRGTVVVILQIIELLALTITSPWVETESECHASMLALPSAHQFISSNH